MHLGSVYLLYHLQSQDAMSHLRAYSIPLNQIWVQIPGYKNSGTSCRDLRFLHVLEPDFHELITILNISYRMIRIPTLEALSQSLDSN
mmetsp:Transcript_2463/g.4266  ORF Transcript_2463/g.4266 Transcript_2463/m.4266 type:complete len:88 (+) Transcript_2463:730-993(+)